MSKKVFNVFSILCFALVLCFIGCTELINPKTETDINLNIDLSKIIKSTRNTGETQSSVSLGENPTIKVAIYDAKKYNATTNSTDNLDLITEAQAKIVNNEAKVKLNNIPVGIDAIVFAELSFSNGNSTEVMYAGNSEVFRVKPTDNKISLVLMKVEVDIEVKPDDSKPEEIINAKEPKIIEQPMPCVRINTESDNEPAKTYLTCTAKSIDGGNLSFKWWYKSEDSTNFEEFNSILEPSLNDDGSVTSSTMQIEANKNDSFYFYCEVTNTNENATRNKVASVRSNTVQVACIEETGNQFTLFQKNSDGKEVTDVTGANIETSSTAATKVTVTNPDNSDSVWTYFVKPENKSKFIENANYKVSVELKAGGNETTVVGIAAARADYFFTVNSDWTTCEFETGYVKGSTDHDFTIGLGLSSEIEIRNLKIEKLETTDTPEPSLVFDISKDAINSYLEQEYRPKNIVDVSKLEGKAGYNITINTPMCHSTGNSTGTDDSYIQDVKLHLRSYGKETGANRVSFRVDNLGDNTFYTSVMADTASKKSTAWNNGTNQIDPGKFGSYVIDFPNYVANDELIVDIITSSKEAITEPIKLKISEFAVTKDFPDNTTPFANKIFAIQIDETWEKIEDGAPISKEVKICEYKSINFDVLMFNNDAWSDESNSLSPTAFYEATRFVLDKDDIASDLAWILIYSTSYNESGNPIYTLKNDKDIPVTVKISLNENYEVVIEEFTSISGGGIPLNEISSWDDLVTKINDDTTTTEFIIMNDLTATSTITVSKQVKIISDEEVTITRGNSSDGGNFEDSFFSVESAGNLELGSEENKIILDGGNANESPILATAPLITSSGNLTLTNCTLQNNTLNSTVPDFGNGGAVYVSGGTFTMNSLGTISYCKANNGGAVYVSGGTFNMYGGTISHCNANDGGAVYVSGGTFNMNGGTITECSATDSGGGVWMNGGSSIWGIVGSSFTMSGDSKIVNCNSYSEGGGVYVTDSSNLCTFKMLDNATITSCNAENNGGGVSYGCGLKGTFEISGNAKINSNISSYCGGGIYLYGLLTMNGGTISDNKATVSGAGVYLSDSTSSFTMNGGAYVDSSNDVYLASGTTVTVAGELTSNTTPVATITPFEYTVGTQVLTADDNNLLEKSVDKFALTQSADGTKYEINTDGKLVLVSQNYAEGLTYIGSSTDSPGTLYISSAKGLATFRNIVNGSFESDIIVKYQDNTNSAYTFFAGISQLNINAVLENDIDLKNESWTPIGNSSSDKTYEGTFDGAKYEIKGLNINSSDTNPIGLFGSIKGGTVKNLVVQGSITSSYFTGGITGYLNGGTIENCVNNVEITNSAVNGTGGIVGYVASDGGTIQNCINLVSVTGGNSVGGIVGGAGPSSFPTIKKCINIGDIKASSGIASGIYGYATTSSSSSSSILDCINLGSINGNYACGIVYNSEGYTSVSNCINIGSLTGTSVHAIANSSSGTYSNNYYDSTKITNYDKEGITGKSTSDLIGSNISLDGISDDDQWSFAEGRYLLPNIAENIPDQIWATVEVAAISDSSSVSGGGFYSIGDVYYQNNTPMGVVFEVADDNSYIKIVALEDLPGDSIKLADTGWIDDSTYPNAYDHHEGSLNSDAYMDFDESLSSYSKYNLESDLPAFYQSWNYYVENAENPIETMETSTWYIPAIEELKIIVNDVEGKISDALSGFFVLNAQGIYWSSTLVSQSTTYSEIGYNMGVNSKSVSENDVSTGYRIRLVKKVTF